jgi:hypothetical protein
MPTTSTLSKQDKDNVLLLALAVHKLVYALAMSNPVVDEAYEKQMADDCESMDWDFQYAEALFRWRSAGKPQPAFFSTASPLLLACKVELQREFGLEVVNPRTANAREAAQPTHRQVVDGFGFGHTATEADLNKQYFHDIKFLKKHNLLN